MCKKCIYYEYVTIPNFKRLYFKGQNRIVNKLGQKDGTKIG